MEENAFFVRMQIQLLSISFTLGIRIHPLRIRIHRLNFTFSLLRKLSGIGIRILTLGIRITMPNFTFFTSENIFWDRDSNPNFRNSNHQAKFHFFTSENTFWNRVSNPNFKDSNHQANFHLFTSENTFWNQDSNPFHMRFESTSQMLNFQHSK